MFDIDFGLAPWLISLPHVGFPTEALPTPRERALKKQAQEPDVVRVHLGTTRHQAANHLSMPLKWSY